ncbi:HTTM domain-containing protein [uncultured Microscilla sp.]|uniref:HTTM domain-containing protein n=1 Tax=uncultured Microscilla sp. TaxID=432653 RepID=UPI002606C5B9|nr:HTTM domain-containing protein [uncultured Microscilla sp.]
MKTSRFARPVDNAILGVFRIFFGSLMLVSLIRFAAKGWIKDLYITPKFFFTFEGFHWVQPLPGNGMYWLFGGLMVLCVCIILGLFYRLSMGLFFLGFTYVELIDKTNYLNHYYFISVLSFLLIFFPLHHRFSLDRQWFAQLRQQTVPFWYVAALRCQIGLVYFFAGIAKLKYDWLVYAEPLKTWLAVRTNYPLVGAWLQYDWVPYLMSWAGALFDLSIAFLLAWWVSRPVAYGLVVVFHLLTWLLFNIGIFPWIMMVSATVFFSTGFYQRVFSSPVLAPSHSSPALPWRTRLVKGFVAFFLIVQCLLPLRHWLYKGDVLWTEEGFRFAWNVMLIEKTGLVSFVAHDPQTQQQWEILPGKILTPLQEKMMATQPDMILQLAHHLGKQLRQEGHPKIQIRAKSYLAFNGRKSQPYIHPEVDLMQIKWQQPRSEWLLPLL